ncbi:hypothetical protein [Cecembia sp.]|uniref:InlB B-repeat-containing protein n=1 Tax=Cecembia sp. TaxID=1898110 RepID=UPI0025BCEECE|nr:hypothetical protein [Cecembia sp.]
MKTSRWIVWLSLSILFLTTSCLDLLDFDPMAAKNVEIKEVKKGSRVEVLAEPEPGFTFSHWLQDGEIVSMEETYSFIMPGDDISLVAVFTKN